MEETPKEQIEADLAEVEAMEIEGPTFDEYLALLDRELRKGMKKHWRVKGELTEW